MMGRRWTTDDEKQLERIGYNGEYTLTEIAELLNRTPEAIKKKLYTYGHEHKLLPEQSSMGADTICWDCANACGGCSWSDGFIPVDGWAAEPTKIRNTSKGAKVQCVVDSFRVVRCPLFQSDARAVGCRSRARWGVGDTERAKNLRSMGMTIEQIAETLGKSVACVNRRRMVEKW